MNYLDIMDIIDDIDVILDEIDHNIVPRRPYNSQNRFQQWDNLNCWDDLDFFRRFRLSKNAVIETLEFIHDGLLHGSER